MCRARAGMSMLELVIASTLLTVVVTSATLLLRTSREVWTAQQTDHERLHSAQALMRHIVRHARQAQGVASASGAGDFSGALSLQMPSGETWVWNHHSGSSQIHFGIGSADDLLAEHIESFEVIGYEADGTTTTATVDDMQVLQVTASVTLPRDVNATKTFETYIWLRAW